VVVPGVVVRLVGMLRLDQPDAPGQGHAAEQRRRQPKPVVGVERHFRQQIRQRNAQKHARGKRQAAAQQRVGAAGQLDQPQGRKDRRHRAKHRERQIRPPDGSARPAARGHQRRDRQGIQRLVQKDGEEGPQAPQMPGGSSLSFRHYGRPQCHPVDQRVQRQPQRQAGPTEAVRPARRVVRFAGGCRARRCRAVRHPTGQVMDVPQATFCTGCPAFVHWRFQQRHCAVFVCMHVEEPHQQEHRQKAPQHPPRHAVAVPQFGPGVRQ
jgi:hypothetical protein